MAANFWYWIVDALGKFSANDWLTAGLFVFAGVALLVPIWESHRSRDEARQVVNAEHLRLWAIATQVDLYDPLEMVVLGTLKSDFILPRDPGLLLQMISRLGGAASQFGGMALVMSHDAMTRVAQLEMFVKNELDTHSKANVALSKMDWVKAAAGANSTTEGEAIKALLQELAAMYADIVSISRPPKKRFRLPNALKSNYGKGLLEAAAKKKNKGIKPS